MAWDLDGRDQLSIHDIVARGLWLWGVGVRVSTMSMKCKMLRLAYQLRFLRLKGYYELDILETIHHLLYEFLATYAEPAYS